MNEYSGELEARLRTAAEDIRQIRREYNHRLDDYVKGEWPETNGEDLARLVGTLEAAYNHLLAAIAGDGDVYCVLKHLSYSIILAGEMDEPINITTRLYDLLTIVSGGKIEACAACKADRKEVPNADGDR